MKVRGLRPMISRLPAMAASALVCASVLAVIPTRAFAEVASDWAEGHKSRARLIAGKDLAGIELQLPEGWKTYWRNPGDAGGVPPAFDWSQSQNLARADVLYPAPKRYRDSAGDTVGYKGTVVFPVRLQAKDPSKPIDLRLNLEYGVCEEICIPAQADLSLAISPNATASVPPELKTALDRVPARADQMSPGDPQLKKVESVLDGPKPHLVLDAEFPGGAEHADIFIEAPAGLYVPLPTKVADDGKGNATFEVDLGDAADAQDLKGEQLTATLVSDKGQSEVTFSVD
jgi:DsbC/DsbD-like thiol-disulfide interchange protein